MSERFAVISPEGVPPSSTGRISPHLDTLEGKVICEVYNNHFKGELMFRTYRRLFTDRYPGVKVIPYDELPIVYVGGDPATQKQVAKQVAALAKERGADALITGNGG
jgi:hypothetical protein